jgi:conjugal transfer pilus assembly protein TraF
MIKHLSIIYLCLLSSVLYAGTPVGFLWYNMLKEDKPPKSHGVSFQSLSYTDKDAVLKFYTLEALHKVRFTHKLEDERTFLAWQSFWLREATLHGQLNQMALRYYPQYDFSVDHPTSNIGTKLSDTFDHLKTQVALKQLARTHGILFFYRGQNAFDRAQVPIINAFCKTYHLSLMAVSVDGTTAPELSKSRINHGQVEKLGLRFFPAMLLIEPKQKIITPIAFGLTTQDVLTKRLMSMIWRDAV